MSHLIIGLGGPRDRNSIALSTKIGSPIPNERRKERAPQALKASADLFRELHPEAELRSLTATYDCVGLAFASRRCWVGAESLDMILREDGYRQIEEKDAIEGDVVVYRKTGDVRHIAVIINVRTNLSEAARSFSVVSKWGSDGEYVHDIVDVPELLGTPEEFYSERVIAHG